LSVVAPVPRANHGGYLFPGLCLRNTAERIDPLAGVDHVWVSESGCRLPLRKYAGIERRLRQMARPVSLDRSRRDKPSRPSEAHHVRTGAIALQPRATEGASDYDSAETSIAPGFWLADISAEPMDIIGINRLLLWWPTS
jgi:hypothetical protein